MSACDRVFERLTRGPFPGGPFPDGAPADPAEDAAVERHLASCHDCRRLAEALRPAVSLFHEALERTEDLPRYSGRLTEPREAAPRVLLAEPPLPGAVAATGGKASPRREPAFSAASSTKRCTARSGRETPARGFDRPHLRDAILCTATIAASVAVALILAQFAGVPPMGERTVSAAALREADWSNFSAVVEIDRARSWAMPADCAAVSTRPASGVVGSAQVACCTLCHAAGEGERLAASAGKDSQVAAATVRPTLILSSCTSCHY